MLYIFRQGNEKVTIYIKERGKLFLAELTEERAVWVLTVPFVNEGRQDGIILDAFARPLLPREQFDRGRLFCRLERPEARRDDDYFEAVIFHPGERSDFILTVEIIPLAGCRLSEALDDMPDVTVDIYYTVVGRTRPVIRKSSLTVAPEEFARRGGAEGAA
jgi:hypothetical protein